MTNSKIKTLQDFQALPLNIQKEWVKAFPESYSALFLDEGVPVIPFGEQGEPRINTYLEFAGLPLQFQLYFKEKYPEKYQALFASGENGNNSENIKMSALDIFEKMPLEKQLSIKNEFPEVYKMMVDHA